MVGSESCIHEEQFSHPPMVLESNAVTRMSTSGGAGTCGDPASATAHSILQSGSGGHVHVRYMIREL